MSTDKTISRMVAVHILPIASGFIAATKIGGITLRSHRATTPLDAVQALFARLAGSSDDAAIALDLLITDDDFERRLSALTDGKGNTPDAEV